MRLRIFKQGLFQYLNDLMRVIDMIVEKHTDEEILATVAEVITYFTSNTAVAQHIQTARLKVTTSFG